MTKTRTYTLIALAATLSAACTNDDIVTPQPTQYLQIASPSVSTLKAPTAARAMSRATAGSFIPGDDGMTTPEDVPSYLPYNSLYPIPINREFTTIGAFLTDDKRDTYTSIAGYFKYDDENRWTSTVNIKEGQYNLFGYMPSNAGSTSVSIAKRDGEDSWDRGAKMALHHLPAATPADVCIVVGVLKADVPDPKPNDWMPPSIDDPGVVSRLHQGVYAYEGTATDNYVYLLLEHIYANINVELSVEPKYAELRNIVLKDVYVRTVVPNLVNCDLTLCNDPKKPIDYIKFTNASGAEQTTRARLFTSDTSMLLKTTPSSIPLYFSPYIPEQGFDYEFHYDVYDRKGEDFSDPENPRYGNLVRENCIAINHWTIQGFPVEAGKSFKASVTIKPTYLYMLSEPDLDNPTFEVNVTP